MGIIRRMAFDFDAAVQAPFRMQPGLRRMADDSAHLTPLAPGSRHLREKLAVLSSNWQQALCVQAGFDAMPALAALCAHAAAEHPQTWAWDGQRAQAWGASVNVAGDVSTSAGHGFATEDDVARCLRSLPAAWRLAGLLSLCFAEDFALVDGHTASIPWLAVALPSHWAPEAKIGRHFAEVHGPVADNAVLLKASESLVQLVTGGTRWERFVWNVTDQPRLRAHPADADGARWQHTPIDHAWWRTEHQTFIPLPDLGQAIFTISVDVQRLADAMPTPDRAVALHAAITSMSPAVLAYRGLTAVREPLLAWLAARA